MARPTPLALVPLLLAAAGCRGGAGATDPTPVAGDVSPAVSSWRLVALPSVATAGGAGAETLGVQAASARLALTNSERGTVEVYDLEHPDEPRLVAVHDLGLAAGEEVTCVAVHPRLDLFVVAVRAADPRATGRAQLHRLSDGALVQGVVAGGEPDSVAIDPTGRFVLVANEGESWWRSEADGSLASREGSLTWIALRADGRVAESRQLALPDATQVSGTVRAADGRFLPRDAGGEPVLVPLSSGHPRLLEPEVVAFRGDGSRAVVTLQENNAVVLVDAEAGAVLAVLGLGVTAHAADVEDDGEVRFEAWLEALREPDGIAFTPDGRHFVTADEGDTVPKAAETRPGLPRGGGRTLSVFDARTGALVGDTGDALDRACHAAGCYPDGRSDNRGSEPEMVVTFAAGAGAFALVTLERADALALVEVSDPARPRVLDVAPVRGAGPHAPEGVARYRSPDGHHYAYSANEKSGVLGVFRVEARPARPSPVEGDAGSASPP